MMPLEGEAFLISAMIARPSPLRSAAVKPRRGSA
jgi:hypothetical protein